MNFSIQFTNSVVSSQIDFIIDLRKRESHFDTPYFLHHYIFNLLKLFKPLGVDALKHSYDCRFIILTIVGL